MQRFGEKVRITAQSLLLQQPRALTWVRGQLPELGPHDLLLRTRSGAISLGTELPLYLGQSRGMRPHVYPFMTGYEAVAEVVACGPAVQSVAVGDRVIAFYGHRTMSVVPESRVVPIPPDIPDTLAVLLILACDAAKGISKVSLHPHQRIAITGSGTIGLLTLFNLHARGLHDILVIDPLPDRRAIAHSFGAQRTRGPDDHRDDTQRYDVGFECSSRDAAFGLLQELMQPAGQICILADGNLEPLTLTPSFHAKELTIIGSSDGLDYRSYAAWYWGIVRSGRYPLAQVFEQTVEAARLPEVFEWLVTTDERPLKVFVQYSHE